MSSHMTHKDTGAVCACVCVIKGISVKLCENMSEFLRISLFFPVGSHQTEFSIKQLLC